jgi:SAM-dependent methyltransferase/uncharacterized protein YbaR (Trm112 family)
MRSDLLSWLLCPHCGAPLSVDPPPSPGNEIEYAVLTCGCSEFPVVGGIPILMTGRRVSIMQQSTDYILRTGPRIGDLVGYLRAGQNERALLSLLAIPQRLTDRLLALSDFAPLRMRGGVRKLADLSWSRGLRRTRAALIDAAAGISARDMLAFFYRRSLDSELYNHFVYLFGQPRHLAGLSLAGLMPESGKPILDLACGFGHYMHYWGESRRGQRVIGLDRNFFQLYVAKSRVAPGGDFVCSEADVKLPFRSQSVCGVFCSDAFHYFLDRWQCAEEMKRLVEPGGVIVLSRFGNRRVEPREGYELTENGYAGLFDSLPARLISEEEILNAYLEKRGPSLGRPPDMARLAARKWLSLVASGSETIFRDHPEFKTWPHAAGRLMLNPLYRVVNESPNGDITMEFRYPSKWYEFENSDCARYMPRTAVVPKGILGALESGAWTGELEPLVRQCVVVGMPDRYQ